MARSSAVVLLAAAVAASTAALGQVPAALSPWPPAGTRSGGTLIVVRMVEDGPYGMAFDPVRITVGRGDTIRWVQRARLPHNVEFRSTPAGTELGSARRGPFLEQVDATYELVIDHQFAPGKHVYVCTPHEVMGMAGIVYVRE